MAKKQENLVNLMSNEEAKSHFDKANKTLGSNLNLKSSRVADKFKREQKALGKYAVTAASSEANARNNYYKNSGFLKDNDVANDPYSNKTSTKSNALSITNGVYTNTLLEKLVANSNNQEWQASMMRYQEKMVTIMTSMSESLTAIAGSIVKKAGPAVEDDKDLSYQYKLSNMAKALAANDFGNASYEMSKMYMNKVDRMGILPLVNSFKDVIKSQLEDGGWKRLIKSTIQDSIFKLMPRNIQAQVSSWKDDPGMFYQNMLNALAMNANPAVRAFTKPFMASNSIDLTPIKDKTNWKDIGQLTKKGQNVLEEIIPMHLASIDAALNKREVRVFDYDGDEKWTNISALANRQAQEMERYNPKAMHKENFNLLMDAMADILGDLSRSEASKYFEMKDGDIERYADGTVRVKKDKEKLIEEVVKRMTMKYPGNAMNFLLNDPDPYQVAKNLGFTTLEIPEAAMFIASWIRTKTIAINTGRDLEDLTTNLGTNLQDAMEDRDKIKTYNTYTNFFGEKTDKRFNKLRGKAKFTTSTAEAAKFADIMSEMFTIGANADDTYINSQNVFINAANVFGGGGGGASGPGGTGPKFKFPEFAKRFGFKDSIDSKINAIKEHAEPEFRDMSREATDKYQKTRKIVEDIMSGKDISPDNVRKLDKTVLDALDRFIPGMTSSEAEAYRGYKSTINNDKSTLEDYENATQAVYKFQKRMETAMMLFKMLERQGVTAEAMALKSKKPKEYYVSKGYVSEPQDLFVAIDDKGNVIEARFRRFTHGGMTAEMADKLVSDFKVLDGDLSFTKGGALKGGAHVLSYMYNDPKLKKMLKFSTGAFGGALVGKMLADRGLIKNPAAGMIMGTALAGLNFLGIGNKFAQAMFGPTADVKNAQGVTDQDIAIAKLTQKFIPYAIGAAGGAKFGYNIMAGLTGSKALGALGGLAGGLVGLGVGKMTRSLVDRIANRDKDDQSKLAKFGRWLTGFKMFRGLRHVNGGGSDHMQYVAALKSIIVNLQHDLSELNPKDKRYKVLTDDIIKLQDFSEQIYKLEGDYEKDIIGETEYHHRFRKIADKVEGLLKIHKKDKIMEEEYETNIKRREAYQDTSRADMKYSFEEDDDSKTAIERFLEEKNKTYGIITKFDDNGDILKSSAAMGNKFRKDAAMAGLNKDYDIKDLNTQFNARKDAMDMIKGQSFNSALSTLSNQGSSYAKYLYGNDLESMSLDEIKSGISEKLRISPDKLSSAQSISQLEELLGTESMRSRIMSMGYGTINNKYDIQNILARTKYGKGRDVASTADLRRDIGTYTRSKRVFDRFDNLPHDDHAINSFFDVLTEQWDSLPKEERLRAMLGELFKRATTEAGFMSYATVEPHIDNDFLDYMLTDNGLNPSAWRIDNRVVLFYINSINGEFQSRRGDRGAVSDMTNFLHKLEDHLTISKNTSGNAKDFEENLDNMLKEAIDAIKAAERRKGEHITNLMKLENSSEFGATDSKELMAAIDMLDGAKGEHRDEVIGLITSRVLQMFSGEDGRSAIKEYIEAKSAMYGPSLIARHILDHVNTISGHDPEMIKVLTSSDKWGTIKRYLTPDATEAAKSRFLSFKGLLGKISGTSIDDVYNLDESIKDNDKLLRVIDMISNLPEDQITLREMDNTGRIYIPENQTVSGSTAKKRLDNIYKEFLNNTSDDDDEYKEYLKNIKPVKETTSGRGVKDRFFGAVARIKGTFQSKFDLTGKVKNINASSIGCAMAAFNNAIKLLGYTPISDDTLNKVAEKHLDNGGVEVGFFIEMCKKLKIRPRLYEGKLNTFNYSFFDKNRPSGKKAMVVLLNGENGGHYVNISAMSKDMLTVIDNEESSPKPRQVSISDVQANTSLVLILDDTANQKAIVESTRTRSFLSDPKGYLKDKLREGVKNLFNKAKDKILDLKTPERQSGTGLSPFTITNTTTTNDSGIISAIAASTERIVEAIGINAILSANSIKEGVNIANVFSNNGKYSSLKNTLTRTLTKAATQEAMKEDAMVESAQLATATNTAALVSKLGAGQGVMPGQVSAEGGKLKGLGIGGLMLLGGAALVAGGAYLAKKGYDVFKSGISNLTGNVEERDAVVDEEGNYVQNASYSDTGTGFRQVRGGAAIMASGGMVMGKGGSLMAKGATKIASVLMSIPNKLINMATKGALGKAIGMLGLKEKIVPFAVKLKKLIQSKLGTGVKKLTTLAGKKSSKGLFKSIPILSQIIIGIQAAASLYGGWKNAGKLVGVEQDELTIGQKATIALIKMCYDTLPDLGISLLTAAPGVGTGAALASFAALEIFRTFFFPFEKLLDFFGIRKSIREKVLADKAKRKQAEDMEDNAMRDADGNPDAEIEGAASAALGITNEEFTTQLRNDGREDTSLGVTSSGRNADLIKNTNGNWMSSLVNAANNSAYSSYGGNIQHADPIKPSGTSTHLTEGTGERVDYSSDGIEFKKGDVNGNWAKLKPMFEKVSRATGVPLNMLYLMAKQESGFYPFARSQTSSASGLFQIINSTWRHLAGIISKKYNIENPNVFNPLHNTLAICEYIKSNARYIRKAVEDAGYPLDAAALYCASFFGPAGAVRFFNALGQNPGILMNQVFEPKVIAANRELLNGKTAGWVYNWLQKKMGGISKNDAINLTASSDKLDLGTNVTTPATSISNAQVGQADGLDQGGDYGGSQTANMEQYKNANITQYNPSSSVSSGTPSSASSPVADGSINSLTIAINTLVDKLNAANVPGTNAPADLTSLFNIMVEIRDAIIKGTAATVTSISSSNAELTSSIKDSMMIREQNTIATLN